jgi:tetratricopeptide (TPR) repeat protein
MRKFCGLLLAACWLVSGQPPELVEKSQQAKALMGQGRFAEAVPLYEALVKAVPGNPGLLLNLGMAQHMAGQDAAAVAQFRKVLQAAPDAYPALAMGGAALMRLGRAGEAIPLLEKAQAMQPGVPAVLEALGDAYFRAGQAAKAAGALEQFAAADRGNPKAWYLLGRTYEDLAKRSFAEVEKGGAGSAWWLALVAESRTRINQRSSAFYFWRQALAKNPKLRGAHAAIAEIYRIEGKKDWAAQAAGAEIALGVPDCSGQSAECLFAAGRWRDAAEAGAAAKTVEGQYWRTKAMNMMAGEAFGQLAQVGPSVYLHQFQGEMYREAGKHAESLAEWESALRLRPGDPLLEREKALTVYASHNYAAAEPLLAKLAARGGDAEIDYFLGDTLLQLQKVDAAIARLEAAVRRAPKLLPARATLGRAYLQSGRAQQAVPHLKAALSLDEDGSLHFQLMRAYQTTGQAELAKATMAKYQEMQKANEAAQRELAAQAVIQAP